MTCEIMENDNVKIQMTVDLIFFNIVYFASNYFYTLTVVFCTDDSKSGNIFFSQNNIAFFIKSCTDSESYSSHCMCTFFVLSNVGSATQNSPFFCPVANICNCI